MSVNYRVVRRTLNFDKANPKEVVVAQTEPRATTGLEDLISLIGQISAISRGDVLSVISTLTRLIADELAKGNIVEIGELGRLRFNMRSKAAKSVKEFTHSNILTPTLHFLPGMLLKAAVSASPLLTKRGNPQRAKGSLRPLPIVVVVPVHPPVEMGTNKL